MTQFTGAPIFDADQHMYETPDSLTKYLPRRTYDFMGDNARRFMGLPIANPDPSAVNPPALASA